jgi:hypothetical protein
LVQQCFAAIYNYLFFAHRVVDLNVAPKSLAQVSTNNPISKFPFKGPLWKTQIDVEVVIMFVPNGLFF